MIPDSLHKLRLIYTALQVFSKQHKPWLCLHRPYVVRYAHLMWYKRQCNVKAGQLKLAKIHNHHTGYENL